MKKRTALIALLFAVGPAKAEYYAHVNPASNLVDEVLVGDQNFLFSQARNPGEWLQTCEAPTEGCSIKNYAHIGYTYNATIPAFVPPSPFPSWVLDANGIWQAPIPPPADHPDWVWDEASKSWVSPPVKTQR